MGDTKQAVDGGVLLRISKKQDHHLCLEDLKNIVKDAFKDRFTDKQITEALVGMGIPREGLFKLDEFQKLVSQPYKMSSAVDDIGRWLTIEEWRSVLARLGIRRSLDETRQLVDLTRKQIISGISQSVGSSAVTPVSGNGDGTEPAV